MGGKLSAIAYAQSQQPQQSTSFPYTDEDNDDETINMPIDYQPYDVSSENFTEIDGLEVGPDQPPAYEIGDGGDVAHDIDDCSNSSDSGSDSGSGSGSGSGSDSGSDSGGSISFAPNGLESNPGTLDDLHKEIAGVIAAPFEGIRIKLDKHLTDSFQVSHCLAMSRPDSNTYRFGATFIGDGQCDGVPEKYPRIFGDIDTHGVMNANIFQMLNSQTLCKFQVRFENDVVTSYGLTTDFKTPLSTTTVKLANIDLFNKAGTFVGHYLRSVTPKFKLGCEGAYQIDPNIPFGQVSMFAMACRLCVGDSMWTANIGSYGGQIGFYHKAHEQLRVSVNVETNFKLKDTIVVIGYQMDLPDFTFRGMCDSEYNVCGIFEKKLTPLPATFLLSARINYKRDRCQIGCGLHVG